VDFLERLFGLWPDGGSGATELAILSVPVLIVLVLVARRFPRPQSTAKQGIISWYK
jgi:hypothetical protein